MQILRKLKLNQLLNNLHFIALLITLIGFSFYYPILLGAIVLYLFFLYKKIRVYKIIFLIGIIFALIFSVQYFKKSAIENGYQELKAKICDIREYDTYVRLNLKYKTEYFYVYMSETNLRIGDRVIVKGEFKDAPEKKYNNAFDYKRYLKSENIYHTTENITMVYLYHNFSINSISYSISNFYKYKLDNTIYNFMSSLVFGENNFESDVSESFGDIGISHLLAISGFNILLIYKAMDYILKKFFVNYWKKDLLCLTIIIIYAVIFSLDASAIRAIIMLTISLYFKNRHFEISMSDTTSIAFILILIFKSSSLYQSGFQLSFLVVFTLAFMNNSKYKNEIFKMFRITFFASLSTLPITVNICGFINILSWFINPIYIIVFSYILTPITYLSLFLYSFGNFFKFIYDAIIISTNFLSNIKVFQIHMKHFDLYRTIAYYVIYFLALSINKKFSKTIFILFMIILCSLKKMDNKAKVYFIDVGQGDSFLISMPNDRCNIMIDSYGNNVEFVQSLGISRIDYMIITHSDSDHIESAKTACKKLNTKKLIYGKYEISNELIDLRNMSQSYQPITAGNQIIEDDIIIKFLNPILDFKNINDNSIVTQVQIYNTKFLFASDIEEKAEIALTNKYKNALDCDILKVAHHGSDTSTKESFLKYASPEVAIISLSKDNKYGFPSDDVIERLSNIEVYQTSISHTIEIDVSNNSYQIKLGI